MPEPLNSYQIAILDPLPRTATTDSSVLDSRANGKPAGAHVIINVTSVAAGQTITPRIQSFDAFGVPYDLLVSAPINSVGTYVLKIYPGAPAVPNNISNDFLPDAFGVRVTHSGAGSWTYSVSANVFAGE